MMSRHILSTLFIRSFLAAMNFLLAVLTARYLGAEGRGDVSLFMLNIALVQLVNNFTGGPYLVYFTPRKNTMQLLFSSYGWAAVSSVVVPALLLAFRVAEPAMAFHIAAVSFLFSLFSVHSLLLVGKERVGAYNFISLAQTLVLIAAFFVYVHFFPEPGIFSYIHAMYFSCFAALAVSFVFIFPYFEKFSFSGIASVFAEIFRGGFIVQLGNIAQLLNYRFSFYLLDVFFAGGRSAVGVYSIAVSFAEAVWLVGNSAGLVLYSRISNREDKVYARKITLALVKITVACSFLLTAVLLLFPAGFFEFIFGSGFGEIREALFPLGAGIVILSAGIILSAYFGGTGKPQVSVIGSGIGLAVTVCLGFYLIPALGMKGAALTATLSYASSVSYQVFRFVKEAKELRAADYFFTYSDIKLVMAEIKGIISGKAD